MDSLNDEEVNVLYFPKVGKPLRFQVQQNAISDLKSLLYMQYAKAGVEPEDSDVASEPLPTTRVLRSSQKLRRISEDGEIPAPSTKTKSLGVPPGKKDPESFETKRAKLAGRKRKAPRDRNLEIGAQHMMVWQQHIAPLMTKIHALGERHRKEPGGVI
ncbi:MAG: hypothetical protein Q9184_003943 [Pyrenodesmia sp. 2 TL-2023]